MTAVEPVAPAPQPDRTLIAPVRDELSRARESLSAVANWLHGFWPEHLMAPHLRPAVVSLHFFSANELLAARTALEALGVPAVVLGDDITTATVALPGVEVTIQADSALWAKAFPDDEPEVR